MRWLVASTSPSIRRRPQLRAAFHQRLHQQRCRGRGPGTRRRRRSRTHPDRPWARARNAQRRSGRARRRVTVHASRGQRHQRDLARRVRVGEPFKHLGAQLAQSVHEPEVARLGGQSAHEGLFAARILGADRTDHHRRAVPQRDVAGIDRAGGAGRRFAHGAQLEQISDRRSAVSLARSSGRAVDGLPADRCLAKRHPAAANPARNAGTMPLPGSGLPARCRVSRAPFTARAAVPLPWHSQAQPAAANHAHCPDSPSRLPAARHGAASPGVPGPAACHRRPAHRLRA